MPSARLPATELLLGRRDLLRFGGGLALSSWWSPTLATAAPSGGPAKSCILIYLLGGPPHLDLWDLKPDAPAEIRGPFHSIATDVPGTRICQHLPKLARLASRYALIRSVSHPNHNHTPMIYYTLTGRQVDQPGQDNDVRPPQRTDAPHIGAILAKYRSSSAMFGGLPGYLAVPEVAVRSSTQGQYKRARERLRGGGAGFLGPEYDPLAINGDPGTPSAIPELSLPSDVHAARHDRRVALLSALERLGTASQRIESFEALRRQAVVLTGASSPARSTFSLDDEPIALKERYGPHRFGRALLLSRRLAEAGVPMIAVHFNEMTICDGWDTHAKNFEALESELLPMLDQGLSALIEDLDRRGVLDETLVLVMGEFGRTPRINKDAGRDHWGSCQSVLLVGGGIRGGVVVGSSDRIGAYPTADPVDPVDLHATAFHCLGLDPRRIMHDSLGRPLPLSSGRVLGELLESVGLD